MSNINKSTANGTSRQIEIRGVGLDTVYNLIKDGVLRPIKHNGEWCGSLVDLMGAFSDAKNPRQYWKDHKAQLLAINPGAKVLEPDPEMVANLYHLKLVAPDGKNRVTDVAPLWMCIAIALSMQTEAGHNLRKSVGKRTAAEIKYRISNWARGAEIGADGIRELLAGDEFVPETKGEKWRVALGNME